MSVLHAEAPPRVWPARAAAIWSAVFAVFHVYWALGGRFGLGDASGADRAFEDPAFLAYDLVVAVMCVVGTGVALTLERPVWQQRVPRWMLLLAAWGATVLLIVRGLLGMLPQSVTGLTNEQVFGEANPSAYTLWSSRIVEGFFLVGGVLFALALVQYYRGRRARP